MHYIYVCARRVHTYIPNATALHDRTNNISVILRLHGSQNPATGSLAGRAVLLDGLREVAPEFVRHEVSYCMYGATMVRQPGQNFTLHFHKSFMNSAPPLAMHGPPALMHS